MRPLVELTICVLLVLFTAERSNAQRPELILQTGPTGTTNSLAFTPDGKTVAGGGDYGVKLWDVKSGTELRTFDAGNSVHFSPDGKTFVSTRGAIDLKGSGALTWWDVTTGAVKKSIDGLGSVAVSPDWKILASAETDNLPIDKRRVSVRLRNVETGASLGTFQTRLETVWVIIFSPDGKTLAVSDGYGIELWDVATGAQTRILKGTRGMGRFAFSPDGRLIASGYFNSRQEITIKLWNAATGAELRTISWRAPFTDDYIRSFAFSPDGKTLASASHEVKLWDIATGAELRTLKWPPETLPQIVSAMRADSVAFSPDGKIVAAGSGFAITLWDTSSGAKYHTLTELATSSDPPESFGADPMLSADCGDKFKYADSLTGAQSELRSLKAFSDSGISGQVFSPDGKTVALRCGVDAIRIYDVATGVALRTLVMDPSLHDREDNDEKDQIHHFAFSPNGKIIVTSNDATDRLWNVATGSRLRTFKSISDSGGDLIAFSPDGRILALAGRDRVVLRDVATGAPLRTLEGSESVAFTPDGKNLITGGEVIRIWNLATGQPVRTINGAGAATLSPDGKILASQAAEGARLWNLSTGKELRTLKGAGSLVFSLDSKYVLSELTIWEVNTGRELASLKSLNWRDWLVVTPDGLFDGTPPAWKRIIWRFNNNTFDYAAVEAFFGDFYYPDLLADVLEGKRPKASQSISQKDRRQPQLKMTLDNGPASTLNTRHVGLKIDVAELAGDDSKTGSGAQDLRLFRNGSLVRVWRGDVLKGQSRATLEATVPIIAGANNFTAYAFNRDNIKSGDAMLTVTGADTLKRPGTAYILAVGVNHYSNPLYDLKYAVADAEDFSAEVRRQQELLKRYAQVEIISLSDTEATKINILQKLTQLAARVQPEDAVIVFFAGHGTAQGKQFYLIPHDLGYDGPREKLSAAGLQTILAHSISDRELEKLFEGIDAGQILLVIDACNSGQALEAEEKRRGPMNSKGLAQLAYEKGMYVLTAAQSYQAAQEAAKFGHGFLTYALVEEGLKRGAADREPKDRSIDLREWLNYATEEVPKMQEQNSLDALRGRGRYVVFVGDGRQGRDVGLKVDARDNIQRPRLFYRREADSNPLVIAVVGATTPRQ